MALAVYDRIQETTATTGTGSLTLGGAVAGYQSFAAVGNGNTTFYTILNGTAWEVGIGTYSTTGPTLARTTVLSNSSGTTSPITLVGASNVWCDYPAEKAIYYDANGVATIGSILGYSDTGIVASFASTVAGYNQVILQNKSSATTASTNFNVSNDAATATTGYAELGINSSTYSGTGAFNIAGASYLASASTDLAIGTYGAYNVHFVTNSSTTDAMTIYNSGGVSLGGQPDPGIGTLYANNVYIGFTTVTAAAGTTVLTNSSSGWIQVVGTTTQTIQLPNATTLYKGLAYTIANNSTGVVTIKDNASTTIDTVVTGGTSVLVLTANGTSAGSWSAYSYIPASYDFSTSTANFGTATITNATYNGNTITPAYGGTGLTTFTAANNALYSTGATTLTAGTLPVLAGGTGVTTSTGSGSSVLNTSPTLVTPLLGTPTSGNLANCTGYPAGSLTGNFVSTFSAGTTGFTPSTATTGAVTLAGTLSIANGGTNSTATPTAGGVGYGTGTAHAYSAAGTSGQALISAGASAPAFGALAIGTANTNVSGALTVTNGGTGVATLTGYVYGNGTSAMTASTTIPTSALSGNFVSTFSGGTTGLTPSTATAGAITLAGTLAIANGGTGSTTAATVAGTGISVSGTFPNQTVTNSGVTSAVAGTGISVSGATGAVTFTNSGVTSIVAGTGISVSGATGAVTVSSTASGATITGTTTTGTYYVVGTTSTSGTLSTASISNTNVVSYNANTGALTAVSMVSSSDERLKTNWVNLDTDFVSRLADVKHGSFERISSGNREVGVTAQSLKEVLPEAVVEGEEGYLSVNYGGAALVAAIELAKEVKALRAEIAALKAK